PRALEFAQRGVDLAANNAAHRNTLGVAHYRAGNWQSAIDELKTSEELEPGKYLAHNALFLAMAYWQLGERAQAHQWFNRATSWRDQNPASPYDSELQRFRPEGDSLLNQCRPRPPLASFPVNYRTRLQYCFKQTSSTSRAYGLPFCANHALMQGSF